MSTYVAAYVVTAAIFLSIDYVWLAKVAKGFYRDKLGGLMLDRPKFAAAGAFYLFYVVGIIIFAVAPALQAGSVLTALIYGSLFGFFAYATYDVTNYATLKGWSLLVSVVDVVWGTVLTGFSATAGYMVTVALVGM